ncbi:MAG: metallophosphoesterase [Parvularculaceae bacterium]
MAKLGQRLGAWLFLLIAPFLPVFAARAAAETLPPVIAVGDVHGDYDAYFAILRAAGLIDAKGKWSGGKTVFVQLGDVPDRGPDTKKIIEHLMKLEKQAARKGGRVEALIGNHEAMNVTGDLRYVTPEEYAAFATAKSKRLRDAYFRRNFAALAEFYRGKDPALTDDGVKAAFDEATPPGYLEHRAAWGATGKFGAWVASHDAVAQIGETLFVHGGIGAAYAASTRDAINEAVRTALINGGGAILEDDAGPLWHRGFAQESAAGEAELAATLAAFGATRIVIGHTPQLDGIKALYGGRVIAADTGASKAYGGTRSFLRIDQTGIFANDNGVVTKLAAGAQ